MQSEKWWIQHEYIMYNAYWDSDDQSEWWWATFEWSCINMIIHKCSGRLQDVKSEICEVNLDKILKEVNINDKKSNYRE